MCICPVVLYICIPMYMSCGPAICIPKCVSCGPAIHMFPYICMSYGPAMYMCICQQNDKPID